jgi:DNA-binding protein HU-beta
MLDLSPKPRHHTRSLTYTQDINMAAKPSKPAKKAAKAPAKVLVTKAPMKAAAKGAAKAAGPKPDTVTLRHLGTALAEAHEMPKKQANAMLEDFVGMITKHLKKGARIRMSGLGILQVRKRAARMGRNPATGEAIKIKASKKVAFRAAKELKEQV